MILQPGILALLLGSLCAALMITFAGATGARILWKWDLGSGTELQLALERRTYLVSTLLTYALGFEIVSLFLLIFTADRIHSLFTGAMCAAGTLNADSYGYPLLILKVINAVAAGAWLILNHADNAGYDYPLIRVKYAFLLAVVPLAFLDLVWVYRFFAGLHPDIITSCCGSLFSVQRQGLAGDLASLPVVPMLTAFYACMGFTLLLGTFFVVSGRWSLWFSGASSVAFVVSLATIISAISIAVYEMPNHHCPFCLLQREYGYIGYPLYATLFGGAVAGLGVGILAPFRNRGSMAHIVPGLQRRLACVTIACYAAFTLIASYKIVFSTLKLAG